MLLLSTQKARINVPLVVAVFIYLFFYLEQWLVWMLECTLFQSQIHQWRYVSLHQLAMHSGVPMCTRFKSIWQQLEKLQVTITVEPPNNRHVGDEHFVHCSEVVRFSEVEMYGQYIGRG